MAFRMLARLGLNSREFNRGIDQAVEKGEKGGGKLKAAFLAAGAALATATVAAGAAGLKYAADFDEATTNIRARVELTDKEFAALKTTAMDLGRATKFSATEAAQGMLELVTSGSTAEEALSMIPHVLDLAAASGDGLKETADSVTDIMAQFQLQTKDTRAIVNTLVSAAGSSSASVSDLANGMANVGAVANSMGLNVEDTSAALAVLAENGIKGSEAGTALRSMMLNATRPTKQVRQAWEQLGTSWYDAWGHARPLDDIIKDINKGLEPYEAERANEIMKKLFGSYGITAANALRAAGGINTMKDRMSQQRTAAEVAATQMSSFKAVVAAFGSSVETLGIQIMTPFMNRVLKPLILTATNGLNAFAGWLAAGGNVRDGLAIARKALDDFLYGKTIEVFMEDELGSLELVPIQMTGFLEKASVAIKSGATGIVGSVTELGTDIKNALVKNLQNLTFPSFDDLVTSASELPNVVADKLAPFKGAVLAQLTAPDTVAFFDGIVALAMALPGQVVAYARAVKDDMLAELTAPDTVAFFDSIVAKAGELPSLVVEKLTTIKDDVLAKLAATDRIELFTSIVTKASELPAKAKEFVETMKSDVKAVLAEVAPEFPFLQSIVDVATFQVTSLLNIVTGAVTSVKNLFAHGTDADTGEGAWPYLKALVEQATAFPRAMLNAIGTIATDVIALFTGAKGAGDLATDFPFLGNLIGFAQDTVEAMLAEFGNIPQKIQTAFDGLVQDFPFVEKMQPAIDLVKNLATAFTNLWSGGGDAGLGVDQIINTEMIGAFGSLVSEIAPVAADIVGTLGSAINSIWDDGEGGGFKYALGETVTALKSLWADTLSPIVTDLMVTLGPAIRDIWEGAFKPMLEFVTPAIGALLTDVLVPLSVFLIETLGSAISDLWYNFFKPALESITHGLNVLKKDVLEPVAQMLRDIIDAAKQVIETIQSINPAPSAAETKGAMDAFTGGENAFGAPTDEEREFYFGRRKSQSRATGGPVEAGQLYRVNELGTEFFRPNMGGQVIPIGGAPSGLTINGLTVNANDRAGGRAAGNAFMEVVEQRMRLMQGSGAI